MLTVVRVGTPEESARFAEVDRRLARSARDVRRTVEALLEEAARGGWDACRAFSQRFDAAPPREIGQEERFDAEARCDPELLAAMRRAARNIEDYQKRLLPRGDMWDSPDGGRVGQLVRGLTCVGMYVPGGTAAYPSSVLMNGVPAKVAGVKTLVMVTPPTQNLKPEVLAAANIVGVDRVFALGGAQAIAALALGLGPVPKADKVVGPGNAYVTEAKRQLYGVVDIDMIAGPSEVLVLADETANAAWVAADLLSQAEHDVLAGVTVVSTSEALLLEICAELERQVEGLERREIARRALEDCGAAVLCGTLEEAASVANRVAPEHLELLVREPGEMLPLLLNAGAIFIGPYAPEPLGDYMAGPSHVLPTSGTARFFSPLSVDSFLKKTSVIDYNRASLEAVAGDVIRLAEAEGLTAHANAVKVRFAP